MVEMNSDEILENAENEDVAFLVAGDPVAATTHTDLILRAKKKNIKTQIVHNASIFNSVACCGLQVSCLMWMMTLTYAVCSRHFKYLTVVFVITAL